MNPHAPHGADAFAGGPPFFVHVLGGLMFMLFLLLLVGTLFYLRRTGRVGPPPWLRGGGPGALPWGRQAPELQARQILAERFAKGEIDGDEFLERASALNWTPGIEPQGPPRPGKKRRH